MMQELKWLMQMCLVFSYRSSYIKLVPETGQCVIGLTLRLPAYISVS